MLRKYLKGKIHRAKITQSDLNYVGSITIDEDLLDAAGIDEYESVWIYNINNGERFETYVLKGERGSGIIGLNGAAARNALVGDLVIIVSYTYLTAEERETFKPAVVLVDELNKITEIRNFIVNANVSVTENNFEFISKFIVKNADIIRDNDTSKLINNYILTMKDKKFVESLCFQPNVDLCELLLTKYNFDEGFYRKIISENMLCDDSLNQIVAEKISTNMSTFY